MVNSSQELDRTFGALSDPIRRSMLQQITAGPCSVSDLAAGPSLTLAGKLKHVHVLEAAGLIETKKVGRSRVCQATDGGGKAAVDWLTNHVSKWNAKFDALDRLLNESEVR